MKSLVTDKMVQAGRKAARQHGADALREIFCAMIAACPAPRPGSETRLVYKTCWHAPGYRHLRMELVEPRTGKIYDFDLLPADVQRVIYDCADAVKQINDHPPLDWPQYRAQIYWPSIVPWMKGPPADATSATAEAADARA
jgi:hypothetical protein